MKRLVAVLALIGTVGLAACGNSSGNRGTTVTGQPAALTPSGAMSSGWGYVSDQNLQSNVASMFGQNGSQIGSISPTPNGQTGVFFQAQITTNGSIMNSSAVAPTGGTLNFEVWDSYVGQTDSSGKQIPPIVMGMQLAGGSQINASNTRITFQDSYGALVFSGSYNQSVFQGTVSYTTGSSQIYIGQFQVPTCSFFRC